MSDKVNHRAPGAPAAPVSPRRRLAWILAIGYAVVLFTATHLPPSRLPRVNVSDKLEHFVAYAILAGLLAFAMLASGTSQFIALVRALVVVLVFAALDELTQPLVGRFCDIRDWLADAIGATIALLVVSLLPPPRRSNAKG